MGKKERLGTDHGTHPMAPQSLNTLIFWPSLEVKVVEEGPIFSMKHKSESNSRQQKGWFRNIG